MVKLFDHPYAATEFKPEYNALRDAATADIKGVLTAAKQEAGVVRTASKELYWAAAKAEKAAALKPDDAALKTAATETKATLEKFLKGEHTHKVGDVDVKLTDTMGKGLKDSYAKAQDSVKKITEPASSMLNGKIKTQGWAAAIKDNTVRGMNPFHSANVGFAGKGLAFAKAGGTVAAVYGLGDSILRSKDGEGNDRSFGSRVVEGGASAAAIAALVLAGKVGVAGNVSAAVARV